jgi:hypothetical protein
MEYFVKFDNTNNLDTIYVGELNKNFVLGYQTTVVDQNYFPGCLHKNCQSCGGTGVRKDGLGICVHMISCPCPLCNIQC